MGKCGMEIDKLYKMRDFVENSAQVKALIIPLELI